MNWIKTAFRIFLGLVMTLAGVGHLTFQRQEFQAQVPRWLLTQPEWMDVIVVASGVVEIALGLSILFWSQKRAQVGVALAVFFILIFPGNLSQYQNGIDAFGLDTDEKRFNRLFFQPILIALALWSTGGWTWLKNRWTSKHS